MENPIIIHVPAKPGISDSTGRIVRVVGNSMAYVSLESGDSLAFSAEDIENYGGQSFRRLGVLEGAQVRVTSDRACGRSGISVHLDKLQHDSNEEEADELSSLLAEAMKQPGVKEVIAVYGEWSKVSDLIAPFQTYQNPAFPPNTVTTSSQSA